MRHHHSLPFFGLLVLASFVAMVAGVGDVSERTGVEPDVGVTTVTDGGMLAPIAALRLGPAGPLVDPADDDRVVARTTATRQASQRATTSARRPAT